MFTRIASRRLRVLPISHSFKRSPTIGIYQCRLKLSTSSKKQDTEDSGPQTPPSCSNDLATRLEQESNRMRLYFIMLCGLQTLMFTNLDLMGQMVYMSHTDIKKDIMSVSKKIERLEAAEFAETNRGRVDERDLMI